MIHQYNLLKIYSITFIYNLQYSTQRGGWRKVMRLGFPHILEQTQLPLPFVMSTSNMSIWVKTCVFGFCGLQRRKALKTDAEQLRGRGDLGSYQE